MGLNIDIADAVVTDIEAGSWGSAEFTAERVYQAAYDLSTVGDTLLVEVVPRGLRMRSGTDGAATLGRAKTMHFYEVDIFIQQRVDVTDLDTVDPLTNFVDSLTDRYKDGYDDLVVVGAQVRVTNATQILGDDAAMQRGQFASGVRLVVRVIQ